MTPSQPHQPTLSELTGLTPLSATTTCRDPQAAYSELRAKWGQVAPVELEPGINAWLVLGHPEICQIVRNERLFSRNPHYWRLYAEQVVSPDSGLGPMMFPRDNAYFSDGDKHRRLREPLDDGLAGLDEHKMSRMIRAACTELIATFAPRGTADLVTEYAAVVPMLAVAGMFGLSTDLGHQLRQALIALFGSGADSQAGNQNLERILTNTIQARRADPSDDLATAFLRHPNLRNDFELQQSMVLMISAGYETTTTWIAQTLRLMLTDPRFAGRLRGGRLGIDEALDEVLWRDPPMSNMPARYALADCQVAGQPVRRGDALILGFAAANADSRVHTNDPWLEVGNRAHLAWSAGPHACPAQRQGRMITRIAVDTALHRLQDVVLSVPAEDITLLPSPWTRCPASLPVRFTRTGPIPHA
ncbi:cytochrome P450 [Saccharomonospora marina XMU15]|uniref:Cytochrome P450 n=1 Tax=Saccharomonospora marina XMU15 TaxID=882083 RepID=H5WZS6_9PSEU|nr:cytochrome P450 [Saccharomonospora marina]EHR51863.1 cytochrome P450 [Saccharomonospora marina XMU15]